MRVLLTRLYRILRAHCGHWLHGRRERARRVVLARPSSDAYLPDCPAPAHLAEFTFISTAPLLSGPMLSGGIF